MATYWLKIVNFPTPLSFNALAWGEPPFEFLDELFIPKKSPWAIRRQRFRDPSCVIFTQCQRVTDGQTDGHPDRS